MPIDRRTLLKVAGAGCVAAAAPRDLCAAQRQTHELADYTLRIGSGLIELAPEHIVSTTLYNGQFPGPLLRFEEGKRVTVDVHNDTDSPELVHWHGLVIPSNVDGLPRKVAPLLHPTAGVVPSCQSRRVFVSITPTWCQEAISTVAPIPDWQVPSSSNRPLIPEPTIAKSSWCSRSSSRHSVGAATCRGVKLQPCRLGPAHGGSKYFLLQLPASATARLGRRTCIRPRARF
jgi:Multicopper oxidase